MGGACVGRQVDDRWSWMAAAYRGGCRRRPGRLRRVGSAPCGGAVPAWRPRPSSPSRRGRRHDHDHELGPRLRRVPGGAGRPRSLCEDFRTRRAPSVRNRVEKEPKNRHAKHGRTTTAAAALVVLSSSPSKATATGSKPQPRPHFPHQAARTNHHMRDQGGQFHPGGFQRRSQHLLKSGGCVVVASSCQEGAGAASAVGQT